MRNAESCEALIRDANAFVARAYTRENVVARRSYVFEYGEPEGFAFAVHCPGSPETRHLPGFEPDELPPSLAKLTLEVVDRLSIGRGRVFFNVGRYPERCGGLTPHYDGERFDDRFDPEVGDEVRRGIRPRQVAVLTLRDETRVGGTCLHDSDGRVEQPPMGPGELLRFDNCHLMHSAPDPVARERAPRRPDPPRWIRYILGWRAFEDDCFDWREGEPLRPLQFEEAIALHERFLDEDWPKQVDEDLSRATFPFPERYC